MEQAGLEIVKCSGTRIQPRGDSLPADLMALTKTHYISVRVTVRHVLFVFQVVKYEIEGRARDMEDALYLLGLSLDAQLDAAI